VQAFVKLLTRVILLLILISCEGLDPKDLPPEIPIYIPDSEFLHELIDDGIDINGDSTISYREAASVSFLNLSNYFGADITNLTGIEAFINLEILVCRCNKIDNLNLSKNTKLKEVYAYDIDLKEIDVSGCKDLIYLNVGYDGVCHKNRLTKLDISNNPKLKTLICSNNLLSELDVSNNPDLECLFCPMNQISEIDLSNNICLKQLEIWCNQLTSIDVSHCETLTILDFALNQLTEISLEHNRLLVELNASKNLLNFLNLSNNPALKILIIKDMPTLQWICLDSSYSPPADLKIYTTDNSEYQLLRDCI
jgi:hypothetical protein